MRETALALGLLVLTVGVYGRPSPTLLNNGELVQHSQFKGRPKWNLIPYLWTDKSVNITCEFTKDFKVYTAPSLEALSDKVSAKESVWCGWHNFLGQHSCVARLSPFGPVHVAVEHSSVATQLCTVELEEHISYFMIAQTIAGVLLFLFASQLSASMFFRLGTGSAGVMLLSVLILLFLLSRTLPSKRSAAAMFAIFGSSFTGMVRYVFGQWIPSFEQLICNKVVLVYLALSGLVGLATTYYFDREDNVRLHNILKYGLKLVGLGLMAFSTSMPEASVTLCCILLLSQLVQPALFLWHKGEVSERTLSELVSESPAFWRRSKPRTRASGASRLKPKKDTLGWDTPEATQEEEAEDDFEDGEELELSPSSEESSERAFLQAAKMPLPGEERHPAAASSEYKREIGSPAGRLPTGASDHDSPWIKRGLALNLETGRTVKIHGSTWNKLMVQGYQLDRQQGTLTPPVKAKQGSASATPSPASRVKARRS